MLETNVADFTGSGFFEFTGNSPLYVPARSPLVYSFTIAQDDLHYLHLFAAKEHTTINGELHTDVANDAYVRVDGVTAQGPTSATITMTTRRYLRCSRTQSSLAVLTGAPLGPRVSVLILAVKPINGLP